MKYDENLILSLSRISVSYLWSTRLFYLSLLFCNRRDMIMEKSGFLLFIDMLLIMLIGLGLAYLLSKFIDFLAFICEYATAGVV